MTLFLSKASAKYCAPIGPILLCVISIVVNAYMKWSKNKTKKCMKTCLTILFFKASAKYRTPLSRISLPSRFNFFNVCIKLLEKNLEKTSNSYCIALQRIKKTFCSVFFNLIASKIQFNYCLYKTRVLICERSK